MSTATVSRLHSDHARASAFRASCWRRDTAELLDRSMRVWTSEGEREKAQRNAVLAFTVRCASAGLLYLSQILLARWMGSNEYGIYVFVWTWVLILGGLSHLGLNLVAMRLGPAYGEQNDLAHQRGLFCASRWVALAAGTLVMLAGMAGVAALGDRIESHFLLPLYLALVCVPLFALTDVQDGIGRGSTWMGIALLPPYVLRPVMLLATMAAANTLGFQMTAATAAGAAIVATWGAGLIQTALLNRRIAAAYPQGPRAFATKSWLGSSLPLLVIIACELALQNTDVLVVSRYMSPTDVAIYFAAGKTMALIMFVHYAVGSAAANRFAALGARGDRKSLEAFVRDSVNWTFWPSLAGASLILALGKPLLALFGPQFEAGYPVMCILVAGFLFRSAMGPADYLLNMLGEQKLCAAVMLGSALFNALLNFALVPHFGLAGAAASTSMALVLAALLSSIAVRLRLGIEMAVWTGLGRR